MFWLYLLAVVTVLAIVLRRVLARQNPLNNELYLKQVAIEHVQTGVAWVRADSTIGSINESFGKTFHAAPKELVGREWLKLFPPEEHYRIQEAFSQSLLSKMSSLDAEGVRFDGTRVWMNVRLIAVHDHKMRFVGHHCLIVDRSRERELEEQLAKYAPRTTTGRIHAALDTRRAATKS
jgi:PAS domain S-box-containing protein